MLTSKMFDASALFKLYCETYSHRYYEKVEDDEQLCRDIITAIEEKSERKVKNKYPEIFSWLPKEMYGEILNLLTIIENGDTKNTDVFNNVRKILDWVMSELNTYGILAVKFTGANLNECSKHLCQKDLQDFIPEYMQRQIHSCCIIANEGSHRLVTDGDVRTGAAPFLIRSTVFELLNILMWMHQLPDDDETRKKITDIAIKLKKDEPSIQEEPQEPQYDGELNVWHCGDTMLAIKSWEGGKGYISSKRLENKQLKIKEKYPFFAKFKKIKS